jgi:hypothetical protein
MESMRSRYRRAVESLVLGGLLVTLACTPAFHERESEAGGAAGDGGTGAAGRAASSTGGAAAGNGGSSPARGGGSGGGPSGGVGGSAQGGTHSAGGGTGGSDALGGKPGQGGSPSLGGTDALGGTGAVGGTDALGGTGAQGGAPPEGGRGPLMGGAGGMTADAGRAGAAGAAGGPNLPVGCTSTDVIDDMEDGDQLTCASLGRSGDWWTAVGPTTATIDPPTDEDFPAFELGTDARAGSTYGMHLGGEGFGRTDDDWASLGFFVAGGDPYSLSAYQGIRFYGKANVALTIHVVFATATTTPTSEGGDCQDDCNDHYALGAAFTTSWKEFTIPFASLVQEGWGEKDKDLGHTLFVYFGYVGPDGGATSFDFLVDDILLY